MKMNNFRGDLTVISAKKEARVTSLHQRTGSGVDTVRLLAECDAAPLRVFEHSFFQVVVVGTVF